jgi:hypothetical protein
MSTSPQVPSSRVSWFDGIYRQLHLDAHFGEFKGIYQDFDAEACARVFEESGFQMVSFFSKCWAGYSYYPTSIGVPHPGLRRDFTGELTAALKKRGIRCILYFMLQMERRVHREHPEWILNPDPSRAGAEPPAEGAPAQMCINSSYLVEFGIPQLKELLSRYEVDGFFLDIFMHQFQAGKCYCPSCREAFAREVGGPMPVTDDAPGAYAYRLLRNRQMEAAMAKVQAALAAVKPEVSNIFNWSWMMRYPVSPPAFIDHLSWDPPVPNVGMYAWNFSIEARYLSSLPRVSWSCMSTRGNTWQEYSLREPEAFLAENAILLGACGRTYLSDIPYPHGNPDPAVYDLYAAVNRRTRELEPFVRGCAPVRDVAVLHSGRSAWSKAPIVPTPEWNVGPAFHSVCGAHKALVEGHVQMELYNSDVFADAIPECGAIVLADQLILSPSECEAIRRFVREGGALIVTGETGTRDEQNVRLPDFALADVLGVSYRGAGETGTCYLRTTGRPAIPGVPSMDVHVPARYARVTTTSAQTLLELVPPYEGISRATPPPARESEGPGVTVNAFGKGKAVYCAPQLFGAYFTEGTATLRKLALWMLELVYPESSRTIALADAPINVELFYNRRGEERLVHLVGYSGDKREKGVPRAQDFALLHGIRVRLRLERKPRSVKLVPEMKAVRWSYTDGWVEFQAEPLRIHSVYLVTPVPPRRTGQPRPAITSALSLRGSSAPGD